MGNAERPASRTAWRVAVRRAAHQLLDRPVVLEDPVAIPILGPETAAALQEAPATFEAGTLDPYLRAFMAARARFAEDHLDAARDAGVTQYVVLGAGLDTFAYRQRRHAPPLRIWEIDHPGTQGWKRRLLADAGIDSPANLRYVPVDFERDDLAEALAAAGFERDAGAVFTWLGVTMYLTDAAFAATIAEVARAVGARGGVSFDYSVDRSLLTGPELAVHDALAARVARAGEPWLTTFAPQPLASRLRSLGFTTIEDADGEALNARYFAERADGLRVGGLARLVWAGR